MSPFNSTCALELVERVEPSICDKLANVCYSDFLRFMEITDTRTAIDEEGDNIWNEQQYKRILRYCRYMKAHNYTIKQKYSYAYNSTNGRLFVSNLDTNKAGLQNINRFIRGCLVDGLYTDIDMVNAHPNLLRYICEQNNISCPNLYNFTTSRDDLYDELMAETNLSRGEVKVLFLRSINSSLPVKKYSVNGKVKANIKNKQFIAFDNEMKDIQKQLLEKNPELKNSLIKNGKRDNLAGKLLNKLLCNLENEVLQLVRKELSIDMAVIAFDGFMVKNGSYVDTIVEKLDNLTSKYNIKWSIKDNDTTLCNDILSCSDNIKKLYIGQNIIKLADDILARDLLGKIFNNGKNDKYYLNGDLFITNESYIKEKLFNWITEQDIYLLDRDNNQVHINNCVKNINDLVSTIISKAPEHKQLREQVWSQMMFKLNFNNGYYDFTRQQFISDEQSETFTKINYDFINESNSEAREFIYNKVLGPMFGVVEGDDEERIQLLEYFLHRLARVMAGHIEDKKWLILNGERDCGKGVISTLLKKCFGDYVRSTNVSNFLYKRTSGDSAKENSWICDYEFKRLAITQEIKNDENECIDGSKIKMFVSGGDDIEARKNFQDEREFKIQSSLMMCVNDKLDINPRDTMEKCEEFSFKSKFVSPDYSGLKLSNIKYYPRDDTLKSKILNNQAIINEFVLIIIESYYKQGITYPKGIKEDNDELDFENQSDEMKIKKLFNQGSEHDTISYHIIKKLLKENGINITLGKFNNLIKGIYNVSIDTVSRKLIGLVLSEQQL